MRKRNRPHKPKVRNNFPELLQLMMAVKENFLLIAANYDDTQPDTQSVWSTVGRRPLVVNAWKFWCKTYSAWAACQRPVATRSLMLSGNSVVQK